VVDASVFVEYLAPGAAQGDVAFLFDPESGTELWTPDLCLLEVANALRKRYLTEKRFTRQHLADGVADLLALGPLVVSGRVLVKRALQFVENLTVYDAVYLALAASRKIPICTLDVALATESRRVGVTALVPGTDPLVT
jgi:predicted nucleic acid-binding protein